MDATLEAISKMKSDARALYGEINTAIVDRINLANKQDVNTEAVTELSTLGREALDAHLALVHAFTRLHDALSDFHNTPTPKQQQQ